VDWLLFVKGSDDVGGKSPFFLFRSHEGRHVLLNFPLSGQKSLHAQPGEAPGSGDNIVMQSSYRVTTQALHEKQITAGREDV